MSWQKSREMWEKNKRSLHWEAGQRTYNVERKHSKGHGVYN